MRLNGRKYLLPWPTGVGNFLHEIVADRVTLNRFDYLLDEGGAKDCGSVYLSNRHVITLFYVCCGRLGVM